MANIGKELKKLFAEIEAQGGRIKPTKKGYMIYPPDPTKDGVAVHKTPSDHRAMLNMRAELRRAGFDL